VILQFQVNALDDLSHFFDQKPIRADPLQKDIFELKFLDERWNCSLLRVQLAKLVVDAQELEK
jgi:hypothetical protein